MIKGLLIILALSLGCVVVGCVGKKDKSEEPLPTAETEAAVHFAADELLDTYELLGKRAADIGISDDMIEEWPDCSTCLDGTVSGKSGDGRAYMKGEDKVVTEVSINAYEAEYEELKELLTERFGEPSEEGMEPYAKVNGGAVTWVIFETDGFKAKLSKASEQDWCRITYTQK